MKFPFAARPIFRGELFVSGRVHQFDMAKIDGSLRVFSQGSDGIEGKTSPNLSQLQ